MNAIKRIRLEVEIDEVHKKNAYSGWVKLNPNPLLTFKEFKAMLELGLLNGKN